MLGPEHPFAHIPLASGHSRLNRARSAAMRPAATGALTTLSDHQQTRLRRAPAMATSARGTRPPLETRARVHPAKPPAFSWLPMQFIAAASGSPGAGAG